MKTLATATATLDNLTAQIKMKLVENQVLTNTFNRNINQNSIEIGQMLTQAKKLVKHGQWQFWLDDNFQMTDRTARNYMKVAAYFGVNSTFKTENVFRFQPAALIELTKMTPTELQKFFDEQEHNGVDLAKISVRNLSKIIKQWKNPAPEIQPTTIDVDAEIKTAPPDATPQKILRLPRPQFRKVPEVLQAAANEAGLDIQIDFSRADKTPPANGILITRASRITDKEIAALAACLVVTPAMEFERTDATTAKRSSCLWYFGGDEENFSMHFGTFGTLFFAHKQK